jgi:tripartite-type tricarboxylate transporter receptor subunit TctC
MTLIATEKVRANNFKELLAYLKANKDKVNYANAGIGAASHLCGMLFMKAIDSDPPHRAVQGHGAGDE